MRHAFRLTLATAGLAAAVTSAPLQANEPIEVVASFSVLADMVERVGGEHVTVTSLVGPDSDPHMFSPSPTEARAVSRADLVVFNGLNYEGWMERLIEASDYDGARIVASEGIAALGHEPHQGHAGHDGHDDHEGHDHGPQDPHAWQDLTNAATYVANIRDGLIAADPAHEEAYRTNARAYGEAITALDEEIHALLAEVPADSSVITGHVAFEYFANAYGIRFLAPTGLSTEAEPSAADMARLIDVIREQGVSALFHESMTSTATLEQLAEETGLPIAGTLYSGSLAAEGEASSYLGMMRHNARVLHEALAQPGHHEAHDHGHEHDHHDH
ncbi:zinc ABC transporter substrate-binding protein [Halomonas sp. YLGW01]|uniref:metal ABC transporter solute-binding protein, Zn/Mn family n=1 Tax=Halomonas sp. YLGW01 TaxID=2773308 RepID=UPI0017866571|nr:zinc ABC transporter substrate-binding protein [Halomonas sp. YLGW01]